MVNIITKQNNFHITHPELIKLMNSGGLTQNILENVLLNGFTPSIVNYIQNEEKTINKLHPLIYQAKCRGVFEYEFHMLDENGELRRPDNLARLVNGEGDVLTCRRCKVPFKYYYRQRDDFVKRGWKEPKKCHYCRIDTWNNKNN